MWRSTSAAFSLFGKFAIIFIISFCKKKFNIVLTFQYNVDIIEVCQYHIDTCRELQLLRILDRGKRLKKGF